MLRYKLHSASTRSRACAAATIERRRGCDRSSVYTVAAFITGKGLPLPLPCTVRDISETGARLEVDREGIRPRPRRELQLPDVVTIYLCPSQTGRTCRLSWQDGHHFGVEFVDASSAVNCSSS